MLCELASCFRRITTVLVFIYSSFTLPLGILLLFTGFILQYRKASALPELLDPTNNQANEYHSKLSDIFPNASRNYSLPVFKWTVLWDNVSIILIAIGLFIVLKAIWGYVLCFCFKWKIALLYTCFEILTLVSMIGVFLAMYWLNDQTMIESLSNYKGLRDSSLTGMTWNAIMLVLDCCGVEGHRDFEQLENWPPSDLLGYKVDKNDIFKLLGMNRSAPDISESLNKSGCSIVSASKLSCRWLDSNNFKTPMACCKRSEDIINGCHLNGIANETNNWMSFGCLEQIRTIQLTHEIVILVQMVYCLLLVITVGLSSGMRVVKKYAQIKSEDISDSQSNRHEFSSIKHPGRLSSSSISTTKTSTRTTANSSLSFSSRDIRNPRKTTTQSRYSF